jgi:DNA-binding HxlR family transcriptional regulator
MPPHVEYTLTPLGREVAEHVSGLGEWIEVNLPRIMLARRQGTSKSASRMHASK